MADEMADNILRIFICGAQSTGKTTILKDLLDRVNIKPERDVARSIMQQNGWTQRSDIDWKTSPENFEKLQVLMLTRLLEIDETNSACNDDFISDRGIDPIVYTAFYFGNDKADQLIQTDVAQRFIERLCGAQVFVVKPHKECVADDGVRLAELNIDTLHQFTDVMLSLLQQQSIPHHVVSVLDRQQRVEQIVDVVRRRKPSLLKEQS